MSRTQNNVINVLTILLLNIAFWISGIYPKHILETTSFLTSILNLIYYVVFDYVLILVFSEKKSLFSGRIFKKESAIKLVPLIIVQLVFDGICVFLNDISLSWRFAVIDIALVLQWFVVYVIITYRRDDIFKNRKIVTVTAIIFIATTFFSLGLNTAILSEYSNAVLKYNSSSEILEAIIFNAEFIYSLKLLAVDCILGISLMVAHSFIAFDGNEQKATKLAFIARIEVVFFAIMLVMAFKIELYPYDAIIQTKNQNGKVLDYEFEEEFDVQRSDLEIYRFSKETKDENLCYYQCSYRIIEDGVEPLEISMPISSTIYFNKDRDQNKFTDKIFFIKFSVGKEKASIYNSRVICYYENDKPFAIDLEKLDELESNNTVIEVCRQSLERGNIFIFEYCAEYLNKYDNEFISKYIERYSKGEFTKDEIEWMELNCYRNDFVIGFARSFQEGGKVQQ